MLFNLVNKSAVEDFENFVRKRRAAVFFSAALFAGIVIDAQLRSNIDMIVTLGSWVRCGIVKFLPFNELIWEIIVQEKMSGGVFPILRNMSHLLTALLYGIMLMIYFVIPRGCYAATRQVAWASVVLFVFLAAIGASYSIPWYEAVGTALVGAGAAGLAYHLKRTEGGVKSVVGAFADYLNELCKRDESALRALEKQGFDLAELRDVGAALEASAPKGDASTCQQVDRIGAELSEEALWHWYFRWRGALRQRFSA